MKRILTLTLLTAVSLTLIPTIAQARYRDGMNLYEYVQSEPISGQDPTGLWKISRDSGYARAIATAEKGDEILDLALDIHLEPDEFYLWMKLQRNPFRIFDPFNSLGDTHIPRLKTAKGSFSFEEMTATYSSGFTIQTKICEGQTVTIPNEFLIIWGVHDLPKDYYPLAGIHAMYAGARTARSRAMTDGFRIESIVEPKWYQAVHYLKSPNLHAMMFAGHGTENGGLILSDDESPIQVTHEGWSQPETLHGSTNNVLEQGPYVHHKLAGMLLLACRSLIPSSDQKVFNPLSIPKDLKGQVSGWEVNVAPGGTLGGYIGDVDHTNIFPRGLFNKGVHIVDLWRMHSGGARYIPGERKLREKKISKRYIRDVAKNTKREIAIIEGRVITPE